MERRYEFVTESLVEGMSPESSCDDLAALYRAPFVDGEPPEIDLQDADRIDSYRFSRLV